MNVLEAIRRKRAVRKYQDRPLPEDVVQQILYAGRRAQSSKNSQPWHFVVVRDKEMLAQLSRFGDYMTHVPSAAMLVSIVTPDPKAYYWVMFDAGQAAAYMQLEAVELGVGSCVVTFHRPQGAKELLGLPDDLHPLMSVAFGYPADPASLEPAARPGGRKANDEIIHYDRF